MQKQLLHAPIQQFADVDFVFRRARDFVNPSELLELLAGLAQHADNFSVQREFVDAARDKHPTRRALESGPGVMQIAQGAPGAIVPVDDLRAGFVADGRHACSHNRTARLILIWRKKFAVAVEHLNAAVAAVGDVDIALRIRRDAVRRIELAGPIAGLAPRLQPLAVLVVLWPRAN